MKGSEANTLVDPFILQDVTGTDVGYECSVLSLLGWGDLRTDEGYIAVCQPPDIHNFHRQLRESNRHNRSSCCQVCRLYGNQMIMNALRDSGMLLHTVA